MRIMITMLVILALSGCSTGLSKTGLATTATTVVSTAAATAIAGPVAGAIVGVGTGVATDVVVNEESITVSTLEALPEEDRASVLKNQKIWEAIEHIGVWIIMSGVFILFILPLLAGWINSAIKGRRYKKEMVIVKENLFDNPHVSIKDLTQGNNRQS